MEGLAICLFWAIFWGIVLLILFEVGARVLAAASITFDAQILLLLRLLVLLIVVGYLLFCVLGHAPTPGWSGR